MKYSKEFKEEALKLSDEIGLKKASQQLGIRYYTLSDWRSKRNAAAKAQKYQMSDEKLKQRNFEFERENDELPKANAILKDALVFFRKRPEEVKTSKRHLFVNEYHSKYGAKAICRFLKINESGYYRWLRNKDKLGAR